MKKISFLLVALIIFAVNFSFASVSTVDNVKNISVKSDNFTIQQKIEKNAQVNLFTKINNKILTVKQKVKKTIENVKSNGLGGLKTPLLLMLVGLLFFLLAGVFYSNGIIWTVGAIFFIVGAILLLLQLL
jgi:Flp pilus assembly protein TadB